MEPVLDSAVDPMLPRPYRVTRNQRETHDTVTLELVPCDGQPIPGFAPGQFNMLYAFGVGEVPISISGDPQRSGVLVHTLRSVGAVTEALCTVASGDVIGVRGPFGTAWPVEESSGKDVVIVAGGIGLAPLRPAFYHVLARRREYGRISLIYGARSPGDILYRRELSEWRGQFGLHVDVTVDRTTEDWFGPVGVVTKLLARAVFDPLDTVAFLCGPEIMMRFAVRELERRGLGHGDLVVSLERNMKCAIGFCGHCQLGPAFLCTDGPVFRYDQVERFLAISEL